MSLQTVEIMSVIITFDQEKTKEHRTNMSTPCDCQDCRNYYKHIGNNTELVEFLSGFGVKITFQKGASVPCDRSGEFFWICIEGDFPNIKM